MSSIEYTCISTNRDKSLTANLNGQLRTVRGDHPNFDEILEVIETTDQDDVDTINEILDLIDEKITHSVARQLSQLSTNVEYDAVNEEILYDGKPIHSLVTEHILASLTRGDQDWRPLAKFLDRVQENPSFKSRQQLYDWIAATGITIATDGRIIAFKGLDKAGYSHHSGGAVVNGTWVDGQVPNEVGSVIELDRANIDDESSNYCSFGLHVGTWGYAQGYNGGRIATVLVDPRDFVSVPSDAQGQKGRVCRYEVIRVEIGDCDVDIDEGPYRRNSVVSDEDLIDEDDFDVDDLHQMISDLRAPFTDEDDDENEEADDED